MGSIAHHALIVTSLLGYDKEFDEAHTKALELRMSVTPIINGRHGYRSFMIGPDGSKEGFQESHEGDIQRAALTEYLEAQRYDDGFSPLDWVEVEYGTDNLTASVVRDSSQHLRPE